MKFIDLGEGRYLRIDGLRGIAAVSGDKCAFQVTANFDGAASELVIETFDNVADADNYARRIVEKLSGGTNEILVL